MLLVGLVVGGIGSIPGSIFGGMFILFIPNMAEDISKALAWAVFGLLLIAVTFLMPAGAAGLFGKFVEKIKNRGPQPGI